jgi:serine/threonine protein kinase
VIGQLRAMPIQPPSRWNPRVPPDLDNIVMTALQRDPEQRWQSAAALAAALQAAARAENLMTSPAALSTWVEWAFTQEPREDAGGLTAIIADLGDTSDPRRKKATTPTALPTTPRAVPKRIDTNVQTNPVPVVRKVPMLRALALIVLLAAGAASAAYFAAGLF